MFGRSPNLPVDAMMGTIPTDDSEEVDMPQFVQELHHSLKDTYTAVREHLSASHQTQKNRYDKRQRGNELIIGHRVWLYRPVVKPGMTKKFASFWRGPYTVVDKTGPVNYRIRLIGGSQTLVVHRNRLKLCYGEPKPPMNRRSNPKTPTAVHCDQTDIPRRTYSEVVSSTPVPSPAAAGGYTTITEPPEHVQHRPTRNRRPPQFYGNYVTH